MRTSDIDATKGALEEVQRVVTHIRASWPTTRIVLRAGMLFMGAKHVDGTPFDKPEQRPHPLQIPRIRVSSTSAR